MGTSINLRIEAALINYLIYALFQGGTLSSSLNISGLFFLSPVLPGVIAGSVVGGCRPSPYHLWPTDRFPLSSDTDSATHLYNLAHLDLCPYPPKPDTCTYLT